MAILEVNNIRKSFDNVEVLKGISFSIEKGDVLAIIGSSGSGKTTLLRCLNFLTTPDEGQIKVNEDVLLDASVSQTLSEKAIRKNRLHFGLVFQSFNLFPQYTVKGNITLAAKLMRKEELDNLKRNAKHALKKGQNGESEALRARYDELKALNGSDIDDLADKLLERVNLSSKADSYPCELSGGQKQRVAIARALALSPDILCFDEPTSALDPELTGEVLNVIRGLKSKDSTMIVVTHEMEFAKNVADKVIYMADGVIEEYGTPEEVFDNPKSEKLKNFLRKAMD